MKKIILLFSLITLVGCSQFSSRKDQSQNIVFQNSVPQGKYNFTIVSLNYPQTYSDKISFYKTLNSNLSNLNDVQANGINLLISNEMDQDFSSLLNTGWFDKEILGMKIVEDLTNDDINYLNKITVATPENAGNLQKLLNKQYYLLLQLTDNEYMYNSEFLYTELDKSLLMESILLNRKSLIDNLNKIKKNFIYSIHSDVTNAPIYLSTNDINLNNFPNNPVIFEKSTENSGFKVLSNNLIIFVGNGKNIYSTEDYNFTANIVTPKSLDELKNISRDSTGVSRILKWKRKEWRKNSTNENLEKKFSTWEEN
ncbi:MAG: hypothetical protein ACRC8M_12850 [Cetobacterium sp.]|uniref:hypothetical protein n=1 Tax=Cetobacterium sp. TaxID=2071632 RepID=UPI003F3E7037